MKNQIENLIKNIVDDKPADFATSVDNILKQKIASEFNRRVEASNKGE